MRVHYAFLYPNPNSVHKVDLRPALAFRDGDSLMLSCRLVE